MERQHSERRGAIALDFGDDSWLFSSNQKSETREARRDNEWQSSIQKDLKAADCIIGGKRATARRRTISTNTRPKLRRRPTDEQSSKSDGYKRKSRLSANSRDLEAADSIIDSKNQRSEKQVNMHASLAASSKSSKCAGQSSRKQSLPTICNSISGRVAHHHISRSKSEIQIMAPRKDVATNIQEGLHAYHMNKTKELMPFVPPHIRRRKSSANLSEQSGKGNSVDDYVALSSRDVGNINLYESNPKETGRIKSSSEQVITVHEVNFDQMRHSLESKGSETNERASTQDPRESNKIAEDKITQPSRAQPSRGSASKSVTSRSSTVGAKPCRTNDLVHGNSHNRGEKVKRDSHSSYQSSLVNSITPFQHSIEGEGQHRPEACSDKTFPKKRSKSLGTRESSKSTLGKASSYRQSHGRNSMQSPDENGVDEKDTNTSRRRCKSLDLRSSQTARESAYDEISIHSCRRKVTRHNFDMRQTKHYRGRRHTVDRDPPRPLIQNAETLYRSKSERSIAISTPFTQDARRMDTGNLSDTDDENEFIECYSMSMSNNDDPSQITDTASYDVRSHHSRRSYASSYKHQEHDKRLTEVNEDYDELTEYIDEEFTEYIDDEVTDYHEESVHAAPTCKKFSKLIECRGRRGIKQKQCCCLLMTSAFSILSVGAVVVLVLLPAMGIQNNSNEHSVSVPDQGSKVNIVFTSSENSSSPSIKPTFEISLQAMHLEPAPTDIEGRCSPSNFPAGSSVCEETCQVAKCCYQNSSIDKDPKCDGMSTECQGYIPHCDVFFDPWVQSLNGVIRPPPVHLNRVCRHRRRRHTDLPVRQLESVEEDCLRACLPSKCCGGINFNDLTPDDTLLSSDEDGTVTDEFGNFVMTSCLDKNEERCSAYQEFCKGVFEQHDSANALPTIAPLDFAPLDSFQPDHEPMPIAAVTPSPWFSKFDITASPLASSTNDQILFTPSQDSTLVDRPSPQVPRPNPSYNYPSVPSIFTPTFHHDQEPDEGDQTAIIATTPSFNYSSSSSPGDINSTSSLSHYTVFESSAPESAIGPSNYPRPYDPSNTEPTATTSGNSASDSSKHIGSSVSPSTKYNPHTPTGSGRTSFPSAITFFSFSGDDTNPQLSYATPAPLITIPKAPVKKIQRNCSGDDNIERIINGDKKSCLEACINGLCCFIEEFIDAGFEQTDETGHLMDAQSCYKSNELTCYDYKSCLVMTLEKHERQTVSPSPTMSVPPPVPIVPYANAEEIYSSCSGEENMRLITNQNVEANIRCLNACSPGICCYMDLFSRRGITAYDEQGKPVVVDSCWDNNQQICAGYEECLVLTLAAKPVMSPTTTRGTFSPISTTSTSLEPTSNPTEKTIIPGPITIPAADVVSIANECTGAEKTDLISSGNKAAMEACLRVCSQGACCYNQVFNSIGVYMMNNEGDHLQLESCFEGNEVICGQYTGCLTLSLSYSRPKTSSPTITPPKRYVADAPIEDINNACSGQDNIELITSGDKTTIDMCFNACKTGVCCYAEVFNAVGMQTLNDGNKKPVLSCLTGNEIKCGGYAGCLVLTLSPYHSK